MPEHTETLQNNHHIEFPILAIMYVLGFSNNNIKLDKESFNGNFDDMQYVYDVYLKKYGITAEWTNERTPYIDSLENEKFHKESVIFSVSEEDKEKIQEILKDYLTKYKEGRITSYTVENLDSYVCLKKRFKESIDNTKNKAHYNITIYDDKFIVILYETIVSNNIKINSIEIEMQSDDTSEYINEIVHVDNIKNIDYLNNEFLNIKLDLNLNKFIKKRKKAEDSINTTVREDKVIKYAKKYINRGYIAQETLLRQFSPNPHETKSLNDFIYGLNKKIKQKFGKPLLNKMDRSTKRYKINNIPELFN